MSGNFYVCATPIGNMQDITLRAIEVLKKTDYIACEDKRITRVLAEKYDFKAKLIDCHKFNEKERSGKIISLLNEGNDVVLVSDAGTPLISDPGSFLLEELLKNQIKITSLPGACSITTFLSMLPRKTQEYAFIGFLPKTKKEQIDIFNKYKNTNCVFFDSPQRLLSTLENIAVEFGNDTKISIGRELTKVFEEVKTGCVFDIIQFYKKNILKGEIICLLYARDNENLDEFELKKKIELLKKEGFSTKDISKIISLLYNENKNKIYKVVNNNE